MYIDVNMVSIVTGMMSGACMFRIESSKNLDQEIDNIKNSHTLPPNEQIYACTRSFYLTRFAIILFVISYICNLITNLDSPYYVLSIGWAWVLFEVMKYIMEKLMKRTLESHGLPTDKAHL